VRGRGEVEEALFLIVDTHCGGIIFEIETGM
jgi:hypothetical protein